VDAESTPPDDRKKGADQSAMQTTLTATARAHGRETSCAHPSLCWITNRFLLDVISHAKSKLRAGSQVAAVVNEQTVRNLRV
jgi:hypothetical protein